MKRSFSFLDIKSFELQKNISSIPNYDLYEVSNKETSSLYSAKISNKLINNISTSQLNDLSNELNTISKISHLSILQFIGYSPIDFENLQKPVIITELASKENLGHIYVNKKKVRQSIGWNESKKYINVYGIASAMQFLHKNDIIHCNLNSSNVLLDSSLYPKITGFEFSRKITNSAIQTVNRFSKLNGVERFLAPEVLLKEEYTKSSDVYSFALIVYEIFTKKKAFSEFESTLKSIDEISIQRERPNLIDSIPDFYKSLIERCWSHDPKERPTFDEIVKILKENEELKNDEEYQSYIKRIDESPKTYDESKQFHQFDDIINDRKLSFSKKLESKNDIENETNFDLQKFIEEANGQAILFDSVYIICNKETGEKYTARKSDIPLEEFNENEFLNFSEEVAIISQLNHPSIVKFIYYTPVDFNGNNNPMIITEYCSNSTLKYLLEIQDSISKYDDTQKLIIIYGIALGMSYLHSNNIIHRNLKPENIFLDDFLLPKISGFQISKELPPKSSSYVSTNVKGTPVYLPPEVYLRKEYSKSGDVYSFSLLMYEIIVNKKPFKELSTVIQIKEFVENGKRPEFTEPIPDCWRDLIQKCWSQEPKERPTFEEIVNILRTDSRFITSNIQVEDFQNYVKYIDESSITFNPANKVIIKDMYEFRANSSTQVNTYISLKTIFDTEVKGIVFGFKYLDINDYELQNKIGESRNVFKILEKKTGKQYAAKILQHYSICTSRSSELNVIREVNSISQINHLSFIKLIGYSPIFFNDEPFPTIIMDLLLNRSINDNLEIIRNGEEIPEWNDTIKLINVYGIASGMAYLHSYNIIFRDLKPSNILLDDYLFPKIIDFGISRTISNSNDSLTCGIGTLFYMPPESLREEKYGKSFDVYSFAITVYEIITGLRPFSNFRKRMQIYSEVGENGKRPEFTEPIPDCWRDLIERCWSQEPKERPTFEEIVNILRTDSRFITSNIQAEDFQNYVKYIDESQSEIGYHPPRNKKDYITKLKTGPFHKVNIFLYLNEAKRTKMLSIDLKFINLNKFEKQEKIGEGGFGTVYKVIDKKTGKIYAAKISIDNLDQCSDDNIKNFEREVSIISKLNYPSIMKFIGFNSKNFKNKSKPTIITELLTNGSLDKIIELERMSCGNPDWDDTKKLINIYGIASGMAYLHSLDILHRDLKPANILLDDYLFPKISDFGLSKDIIDEKSKNQSGFKGTCAYSAPEIFQGKYTKSGDVYAFAFIVYEIMTNEELFKGYTCYSLMQSILKGYRPTIYDYVPKVYQDLIKSCWSQNPNDRPTFDYIVDQLKNNQEFVTENVDYDEYRDYIDYIEDSISENKLESLAIQPKVDESVDLDQINDGDFIDLDLFFLGKQIDKKNFFKIHEILSLKNKESFTAKVSTLTTSKFTKKEKKYIYNDVSFISQLNHPAIVKFVGYSPIDFNENGCPVIITEFTPNRTLKNVIEIENMKHSTNLDDTKKLINIYGIASGMLYLHSLGILHRNLKLENILLDANLLPKISEFGYSTIIGQDKIDFNYLFEYSAPEVFQGEYSKSSEVYSFAIIVYEIMSNKEIFKGYSIAKIQEEIMKGFRPQLSEKIPKVYRNLIEKCWSQNPNNRPTFNEIVNHIKTNQEFITESINQEDFHRYIDIVDKYKINIEALNKNEIKNDEKSTKTKLNKIYVNPQKSTSNKIVEEEQETNSSFLDLTKFELGNLISKSDFSKTYKVISKETKLTYLGKISMVKSSNFSSDELINLSQKINFISQLKHPSFLKFIGFSPVDFKNKPKAVIVTELVINGTLEHILEAERKEKIIPEWNDTKKLINIYGIAAGMSYLHSKNVLHQDLKPENIYLNDYLFPKIGDFGLSSFSNDSNRNMTYQSAAGMKGNPIYSAPEVLQYNKHSKSSDVYSFAFIVYEIVSKKIPFNEISNKNYIFNEVVINCNRPEIDESVPQCYRKLIENCWCQNPDERLSFDEIIDILKKDEAFLTKSVNQNDYQRYISFIEESKIEFESSKRKIEEC